MFAVRVTTFLVRSSTILLLFQLCGPVVALEAIEGHHSFTGHIATARSDDSQPEGNQKSKSDPQSYMDITDGSGVMQAHILSMIIAWGFILPVGVVFSIARHRFAPVIRWVFVFLNGLGVVCARISNGTTANLYEGNVHHTLGWVATCIALLQSIVGIIMWSTPRSHYRPVNATNLESFSISAINIIYRCMAFFRRSAGDHSSESVWQAREGRFSIDSQDSYHDQSEGSGLENEHREEESEEHKTLFDERRTMMSCLRKPFIFLGRLSTTSRFSLSILFRILSKLIDRTILLVGYIAILTGIVTYAGIFRGNHIFNGLAHWIKGSIFFWYGLLTLGRWVGCFANVGWAWNVKPPHMIGKVAIAVPSAEFVESLVIFIYGGSNMFLEHIAGWGGAWTASDLEHVSIAVMFFGGGLCGMLVESTTVRNLLNNNIRKRSEQISGNSTHIAESCATPRTYRASMNTFPALVIFLLGIMMSSHHQNSMVSTAIHKQWGTLLSGFAVLRILTYVVMYISPPTSVFPSRPPTELLASFCLICGGIVFMASTEDIVDAVESRDLMAMFVFTLAVALAAFLMAWEIAVLSLKGWAEGPRQTTTTGVDA